MAVEPYHVLVPSHLPVKSKLQKFRAPRETQNGNSFIKLQYKKFKHIKQTENNSHIPTWYIRFLTKKMIEPGVVARETCQLSCGRQFSSFVVRSLSYHKPCR